ncbi:MAG TPA: Hsp33 family molecular chaperone [Hansschlegelia sp.]
MTDQSQTSLRQDGDDRILPFQIEALDVRGRVVRLGPSIDRVIERHAYPPAVSKVLGEAVALTVLLGSSLKIDGRFQLQTRTDGPIGMLVVDFEAPDKVRACARFDESRLYDVRGTGALLGVGHMALTIDQGPELSSRYQGVVALEGGSLEDAAHAYFRQSEQIPTRVRLAVAETLAPGASHSWRAGGMLVQFLPDAPDRMRMPDLAPGDAPEGVESGAEPEDDDAWVEAQSLVGTVEDHELIDPTLEPERLLIRLFNERDIRVFESRGVREACRCSRERVLGMLKSFTPEERLDMRADDGSIEVTCDFCSTRYAFTAEEAVALGDPEDGG